MTYLTYFLLAVACCGLYWLVGFVGRKTLDHLEGRHR